MKSGLTSRRTISAAARWLSIALFSSVPAVTGRSCHDVRTPWRWRAERCVSSWSRRSSSTCEYEKKRLGTRFPLQTIFAFKLDFGVFLVELPEVEARRGEDKQKTHQKHCNT